MAIDQEGPSSRLPVSVVMPVLNEEKNLVGALRSVGWAAEIFVVDSGSTDRTVAIAESHGATVVQFRYELGGPKKKAWTLRNLSFAFEWALYIDGDERIPAELYREIERVLAAPEHDGYYLDREFIFRGKELRSYRPDWNLRFFRHRLAAIEDLGLHDLEGTGDNEIHEHFILSGTTGFLKHALLHNDYRGIGPWIDRHNKYATWESHLYQRLRSEPMTLNVSSLRDPISRNRLVRRFWVRLPVRPLLRFLTWYFGKRAMLDGWGRASIFMPHGMVRVPHLGEGRRIGAALSNLPEERPLRIVTVVPSLARNTGGPAVTLIQGTRAMGTVVNRVVYATDAAQPAAARPFKRLQVEDLPEGAEQVPIRIFRTRPPYQLAFSPGLWAALREAVSKADLVTIHSVNLFPQYAAFTVATSAKVPYVVTPHGALDPWLARNSSRLKVLNNALWQRRMFENAAMIHFTTREEAELANEMTRSVPHAVIPNGLDLSRFQEEGSSERFRTQNLNGYSGLVVLFLGRISKKKGIDLLIRGFARATSRGEGMLVVAGPDDEALGESLHDLARSLDVHDRVRFVGPVYGVAQLDALAAADVWALTSHTENFGNAVVEAMAAGCPVVVSTEVNLASQIAEAKAGVVTSLSVEEISTVLASLLESPSTRAQLSERGRDFARRFDWAIVAPKLVAMFREVANRREQRSSAL